MHHAWADDRGPRGPFIPVLSAIMASKQNPDIVAERAKTSFNPEELTAVLHGGKSAALRRRELQKLVDSDPIFSVTERTFLDREAEYDRAFQVNKRLIELVLQEGLNYNDATTFYHLVAELAPLSGLHQGMFIPTLQSQATPEQQEKWLAPAIMYKMIGTYAQTEGTCVIQCLLSFHFSVPKSFATELSFSSSDCHPHLRQPS